MPKGKGSKRINLNFRQTKSSRSGTNSNVTFGKFQRMEPFRKK